jgi:hypothetical protein
VSAAAKRDSGSRDQVNAVDLAEALVANRRVAIGLPIDQIRDLAAALLIYDQQLEDANRRMAAMMLAEDQPPTPKPEVKPQTKPVHVPIVTGGNAQLTAALEGLVEARWHLEQERHSAGENLARQKFEKAAVAVCNHVTPKKRT